MDETRCPRCGGSVCFPGSVVGSEEAAPDFFFSPYSMWPNRGIRLQIPFLSCLSCGHVWANLAPGELRNLIARRGGEVAKQYLECLTAGRYFDVPDIPEARKAADAVAEIDFQVLSGSQKGGVRRFHELSGRSWDETHAALRRWAEMPRAEKLALFGWRSKDDILAEKHDLESHPIFDRELDG